MKLSNSRGCFLEEILLSRTKCDFYMRPKFSIFYLKDYMLGSHYVNLLILGRETISNILAISQTTLITVNSLSIDYSYIYYCLLILVITIFLLRYIITTIKFFDLYIIALQILPLSLPSSSWFVWFVIATILSKVITNNGSVWLYFYFLDHSFHKCTCI